MTGLEMVLGAVALFAVAVMLRILAVDEKAGLVIVTGREEEE